MWIKITDDNGQIDTSKLPKDKCYVAFRYTNGGFDDEYYGTIRLMANDNDVMFLAAMEATHILLLTDPDAPQPEDVLVEALKKADAGLNGETCDDCNGHGCSSCAATGLYVYTRDIQEMIRKTLSAWEGGKA